MIITPHSPTHPGFVLGSQVSIGSDSVTASLKLIENNGVKDGESSIEQISERYGVQAVVVSIDPKRVYVDEGE